MLIIISCNWCKNIHHIIKNPTLGQSTLYISQYIIGDPQIKIEKFQCNLNGSYATVFIFKIYKKVCLGVVDGRYYINI